MFPKVKSTKLTDTDKWILTELSLLIERTKKNYEVYEFSSIADDIRNFIWNLFAPHYIEIVKKRAYGQEFTKKEQESAWFTLHTVLKTTLELLAPIIPFITDYFWIELYGKNSIHKGLFPRPEWKYGLEKLTDEIIEFNSKIWKMKKDKGLSLKSELKIKIPKNLTPFRKDLLKMHNIR